MQISENTILTVKTLFFGEIVFFWKALLNIYNDCK